ncbi:hypothetical protein DERP_001985 [Dermatophagoides pteronyssinus]|uniref:Uncharacterized protein n=1 Tax=Dermatophagoides pteronyssinus TaxID=6956 RepID=A0ABQ8JC21_DERPT|nr:hypothetical protein DERP_001985 [Dermatophagoides pteronyssinus]
MIKLLKKFVDNFPSTYNHHAHRLIGRFISSFFRYHHHHHQKYDEENCYTSRYFQQKKESEVKVEL